MKSGLEQLNGGLKTLHFIATIAFAPLAGWALNTLQGNTIAIAKLETQVSEYKEAVEKQMTNDDRRIGQVEGRVSRLEQRYFIFPEPSIKKPTSSEF